MSLHFKTPYAVTLLSLCCLFLPAVSRGDDKDDKDKTEKKLPPAAGKEVDFARDIEPIFTKTCYKCHGPEKQKSAFRLDNREAALKGGENGVDILPGKSAESPLIRYVAGLDEEIKMPPKGSDPLSAEEIGLLRAWIDQGAKWSAKAAVVEVPKERDWTPLKGEMTWVTSVAYSRDGKKLAAGLGHTLLFKPGEAKLYDLEAGKEVSKFQGHESTVWSLALDRESKTLATGSYDKVAKLWDAETGKEKATLKGHANWVTCVAFSPDGKTLATGSEDTTVKLWEVATGQEKVTLKGHAGTVRSVAFSTDGKVLASASFDSTVKLWDVTGVNEGKGVEIATLKGHGDAVWCVAFSSDEKTLASGSADGTVKLWALPEGKDWSAATERAALKGHKNWITCLAFSPDGKRIVSGSFDRSVKLWDVSLGLELASLRDLKTTVWSVAFSPDGKKLAVGTGAMEGQEETVKFWSVPSDIKVSALPKPEEKKPIQERAF
jgi:WD40 repeat protein